MSHSRQKPKRNDKGNTNSFIWTEHRVVNIAKFTSTHAIRFEIIERRRDVTLFRSTAMLNIYSIKTRSRFAASSDTEIFHGSKLFVDSKIFYSGERIQKVADSIRRRHYCYPVMNNPRKGKWGQFAPTRPGEG